MRPETLCVMDLEELKAKCLSLDKQNVNWPSVMKDAIVHRFLTHAIDIFIQMSPPNAEMASSLHDMASPVGDKQEWISCKPKLRAADGSPIDLGVAFLKMLVMDSFLNKLTSKCCVNKVVTAKFMCLAQRVVDICMFVPHPSKLSLLGKLS